MQSPPCHQNQALQGGVHSPKWTALHPTVRIVLCHWYLDGWGWPLACLSAMTGHNCYGCTGEQAQVAKRPGCSCYTHDGQSLVQGLRNMLEGGPGSPTSLGRSRFGGGSIPVGAAYQVWQCGICFERIPVPMEATHQLWHGKSCCGWCVCCDRRAG